MGSPGRSASNFAGLGLLFAAPAAAQGRVVERPEDVQPLAVGSVLPSAQLQRVDGTAVDLAALARDEGVLLVFYSEDLERDIERVKDLGGTISQEIFSFPGGRRFHFIDPVGTEFAIWSEVSE